MRAFITGNKLWSESEVKQWEREIEAEVEEAVAFADSSEKPTKDQLFENVFADPSGFGIAHDGTSQMKF